MRLQLFGLAYNLGNFLRRLALPRAIGHWSLRTLQVRLIKIGAKVVRHAGYTCFSAGRDCGAQGVVLGDPDPDSTAAGASAHMTYRRLGAVINEGDQDHMRI